MKENNKIVKEYERQNKNLIEKVKEFKKEKEEYKKEK